MHPALLLHGAFAPPLLRGGRRGEFPRPRRRRGKKTAPPRPAADHRIFVGTKVRRLFRPRRRLCGQPRVRRLGQDRLGRVRKDALPPRLPRLSARPPRPLRRGRLRSPRRKAARRALPSRRPPWQKRRRAGRGDAALSGTGPVRRGAYRLFAGAQGPCRAAVRRARYLRFRRRFGGNKALVQAARR